MKCPKCGREMKYIPSDRVCPPFHSEWYKCENCGYEDDFSW